MGIESWEKAIARLNSGPVKPSSVEIEDELAIYHQESVDLDHFLLSERGQMGMCLLEAMKETILIGIELDGRSSTTYYMSSAGMVVVYWSFDQSEDEITVVKDLRKAVSVFHRQSYTSSSIIAWLNRRLDELATKALT